MKVSIHQPNFMPWLGYFHKLVNSDVFVFFDDVQFPRGKSYCNRVKIKTPAGDGWLTIPVEGKSSLANINQITIDNRQPWKRKHLRTLAIAYKKAPFFNEIFHLMESVYLLDYVNLADFNICLIESFCEYMEVNTKMVRSSKLNVGPVKGTDHILTILKALGANSYLTGNGAGSNRYIAENIFIEKGIKLEYQKFSHPIYQQLWGDFISNLSIIDLLFNCGNRAIEILKGK